MLVTRVEMNACSVCLGLPRGAAHSFRLLNKVGGVSSPRGCADG